MKRVSERLVKQRSGISITIRKGQSIRVVDIEGKQVGDLVALNRNNPSEILSTAVTIDNNSSLRFQRGDALFSNHYNVMLTMIEDTVGRHDLLYPACNIFMYRHQYGIKTHHPSCSENLIASLKKQGIIVEDVPAPFNIFMNTSIDEGGRIAVEEPLSRPGDYIELRAEMDLIVALAACSVEESRCNGFKCTPLRLIVFEPNGAEGL